MLPVLSLSPSSLSSSAPETPERIRQAAGEFEALLIEQMLKSVRETGGTTLGGEPAGDANDTMLELANQQLARVISQGGGLGLTRMIEKGLARKQQNGPETVSGSRPASLKEKNL